MIFIETGKKIETTEFDFLSFKSKLNTAYRFSGEQKLVY